MFGHDYAVPGTYEVTIAVAGRQPVFWKPERSRFEACASGSLLVLAPWPEDMPAFGSDYERFHYLNRLTEAVCAVSHMTDVGVHGLRHVHGGG